MSNKLEKKLQFFGQFHLLYFFLRYLIESPRFLICKGKLVEAQVAIYGSKTSKFHKISLAKDQSPNNIDKMFRTFFKEIVKYRGFLRPDRLTLWIPFTFAVLMGVFVLQPKILKHSEKWRGLTDLIDIVAYIGAYFTSRWTNRTKLLAKLMSIIGFILTLPIIMADNENVLISVMICRFLATCALINLVLYVIELYPTEIRCSALGFSLAIAKLYVNLYYFYGENLSIRIFDTKIYQVLHFLAIMFISMMEILDWNAVLLLLGFCTIFSLILIFDVS